MLARLIEVTSIGVAERALREPIQIPRPDKPSAAADRDDDFVVPVAAADQPNPFRAAIAGLTAHQPPRLRAVPTTDDDEEQPA